MHSIPFPRKMHRRFLLLALCATAGCRHYDSVSTYGVLTLTNHMSVAVLRWEGGNTGLSSSALCSSIDGKCIEADSIELLPDRYTPNHPRVAVWVESGTNHSRQLSFLDADTGERLHCGNCTDDIESRITEHHVDQFGQFRWGSSQAVGVGYFPTTEGVTRLVLLEFAGARYNVTELGAWPDAQFDPSSVRFAPNDATVAWYVCNPDCALQAFHRAEQTTTATPIPCPYNSYLDVGWTDSHPFPQFYWGATKKDMCFLPDGSPALPQGKRPGA